MKTILYTLIFLLLSVPLIAQKAAIMSDSLVSQAPHKSIFNFTDRSTLNNNLYKNFAYLPDSIIRTEIYSPYNLEHFRRLFSHDFNANEIENIDFIENNNIEWDSLNKHTAIFDLNNNRIERIFYEWNTASEQWDKTIKINYVYDANNNLIESTHYDWDYSYQHWIGNKRRQFHFNNNILEVGYIYIWNSYSQHFELNGRVDYFYEWGDRLIQTISYSWYINDQEWVNYSLVDYFYDNEFSLYLKNYYRWDTYYLDWIYNSYWEYDYYVDGKLLELIYTIINEEKEKHDYTYYEHDNIEEELISQWNYSSQSWEDWHDRYIWYYTLQEVADISDNKNTFFKVFPNPVENVLQFQTEKDVQIDQLSIYNTQGKEICYKTRLENNKLDISDLPTGVYIYKIQSQTTVQTGKIVIKR